MNTQKSCATSIALTTNSSDAESGECSCATSIALTTNSSDAESGECVVTYMNPNFRENSEYSNQTEEPKSIISPRIEMPPANCEAIPNLQNHNVTLPDVKEEPVRKEKYLSEMGYNRIDLEEWEEIGQPMKANLYEYLRYIISNHLKPNVQIRIRSMVFKCHMMVLQCYSEFFAEFDQEELIVLPEEKVSPSAFVMIYNWMLDDKPLVQRESIVELFAAANFLRIKNLLNQCWMYLDSDVHFREDTAFMLYLEAKMYNLPVLEELMLTRVRKFFLTLVSSSDFLDLKKIELCSLLNLNSIGVNSEVEIFMSVVRWLNHDWETRQTDMLAVVNCVRFNLMPAWFLITLNMRTDSVEINRIIADPEVRKMIHEGICYTTTHFALGDNGLAAPKPRIWVYDKGCTYHQHLDCGNLQHVSYTTFVQYLNTINSNGKNYWRNMELAKDIEKCANCIRRFGAQSR